MTKHAKRHATSVHWLRQGMFLALFLSIPPVTHATDTQEDISAKQIYSSTQCAAQPQPTAILIHKQSQLNQAVHKLPDRLPARGEKHLQVNFEQYKVLLIHMGQQTTSGYSLSLLTAHLIEDELIIKVNWHTPPPAQLQAQIITQPCILIQIPQLTLRKIQVNDQNGHTKFCIEC